MGAFRGSISFTKFHVRGELPADFRDRFVESIRMRAFRDLDPSEELDERTGWCSIEHPFDLDLAYEKVFFNDYLNLGLRTDVWRIPSSLFKASFREAERAYLAEHGAEKLSRTQKKNLEAIAEACVGQHLDINVALAGLISIGLAQTNFLAGQGKREVVDIVEEDEGGDADLEII